MMIRKGLILLFLLSFGIFSAEAQFWFLGQQGKKPYYLAKFKAHSSMSFGAGSSNYIGDLATFSGLPLVAAQTMRWNAGFQYTRHFSPHFSTAISLQYIRIAGDDNYFSSEGSYAGNYDRNLHFRTDVKELGMLQLYEFVPNAQKLLKRSFISPYVYVGVSGIMFDPMARGNYDYPLPGQKDWSSLDDQEDASYSKISFAVPFGFGFRYKLGPLTDIGFDIGYRVSMSDFLDDVSDDRNLRASSKPLFNRSTETKAANTLVDRTAFTTNTAPTFFAGNDHYITTQIRLIYHLPILVGNPPLP